MLQFFRISKDKIIIISFLSIAVLYRQFNKVRQALERSRASHRELEKEICSKKFALIGERRSNRRLRIDIENLKADKEKYFSLIQKTLENKQVITHEEVHQKITWSNSSINSCQIDSSMTNQTDGYLSREPVVKTRELEAKNEEMSIKLKRVTKILRKNISSDLEEGKYRFPRIREGLDLRPRTFSAEPLRNIRRITILSIAAALQSKFGNL